MVPFLSTCRRSSHTMVVASKSVVCCFLVHAGGVDLSSVSSKRIVRYRPAEFTGGRRSALAAGQYIQLFILRNSFGDVLPGDFRADKLKIVLDACYFLLNLGKKGQIFLAGT